MRERTILLVEDDPDDVVLMRRALRDQGVANPLAVAGDGVEALDSLFGTGPHAGQVRSLPAVVLLDLNLPRLGGLEVLKRIRAHPRTKLVPVVILTSSLEERDRLEGYLGGCNGYVRKPVEFGEFCEAVRTLGRFWLLLNELPPEAPAGPEG